VCAPVKMRRPLILAAGTGAAVAVSGGIGFAGIVVPYLPPLATGPDRRFVPPDAARPGASLPLADPAARVGIAPAEPPIGLSRR